MLLTEKIEEQLNRLDEGLARLESVMASLLERTESQWMDAPYVTDQIKERVTQFVAKRLQQLIPEAGGPYLDGATVPCIDEVAHWVARIPIPFVRQMVVRKVAGQARKDHVSRVDIQYFEKAASF